MASTTEVLGEHAPQCHFVHHVTCMVRLRPTAWAAEKPEVVLKVAIVARSGQYPGICIEAPESSVRVFRLETNTSKYKFRA